MRKPRHRTQKRKVEFAKAYIESEGDKIEATRRLYPEKSHRMLLYYADKLLNDSDVHNLIQKFLLESGISQDLVDSIKSTLKAEKPYNTAEGYIMVPDNEARTRTQETVLKSFGVGDRKQIMVQQMSLKMKSYPERVLKFIKENNREPNQQELAQLERGHENASTPRE